MMGFGWLFTGYFMTYMMSFSKYSFGIAMLGCFLMFNGLEKLKSYNRRFVYPIYILIPLFIVEAFFTLACFDELFMLNLPLNTTVEIIFEITEYILSCAFHIVLLRAVIDIASDLDLLKQCKAAKRNRAIICVYYTMAVIWMLPINIPTAVKSGVTMFLLLLRVTWALLNLVLLYSCYARICPLGDEEMPIKKSRFAFINKIRDESDARQQRVTDERLRRYHEKAELKRKAKQNKSKK